MYNKTFAIIGGDRRFAVLYKLLTDSKINTLAYSVAGITNNTEGLDEIINNADIIILPIPLTRDGFTLNAPACSKPIYLESIFSQLPANKKVFAGCAGNIKYLIEKYKVNVIDYSTDESFALKNAVLTAEGAVEAVIKYTDFSIFGSKCLILGYGRIGKILANYMKVLGSEVTVAARKKHVLTSIEIDGYIPTEMITLADLDYDLILNTVPAIILTADLLSTVPKHCLILDLASSPGGVDTLAAEEMNIKSIHLPGLPSVIAPKTAALIIRDTILNCLREEGI